MDSEKLLHALLGTRTGLSVLGVLGSLTAAHFLRLAEDGTWRVVMSNFSEHSSIQDQVLSCM